MALLWTKTKIKTKAVTTTTTAATTTANESGGSEFTMVESLVSSAKENEPQSFACVGVAHRSKTMDRNVRPRQRKGDGAGAAAWSPRSWLSFLRPSKRALINPTTASAEEKNHVVTDDEEDDDDDLEEDGIQTETETDSSSNVSPPALQLSLLDTENLYAHLANREDHLELDNYARYFGLIDTSPEQESDLTFPANADGDSFDVAFLGHRDDVQLLSGSPSRYNGGVDVENSFTRRIESLIRRKDRKDDEVALLSERDDAEDRHISYNVDTVDMNAISILEDLTLLELKRKAHEGEAAFYLDQESNIFPFDYPPPPAISPSPSLFTPAYKSSPVEDLLSEPEEAPMWSEDLRKRLALQKAYQMKLSYGGRSLKRQRGIKDSPHGELWTVQEGSAKDERSTGSDHTVEADC